MKYLSKALVIIIMMWSLLLSTWSAAGEDYDITYSDPEDDVKIYNFDTEEVTPVSGYGDIDILEIKSSKFVLQQNLILEMRVLGEIVDSETISYEFMLLDEGNSFYNVYYNNGTCMGINYNDMKSEGDILVATGQGTDTLTVTVPIKNLGAVVDYDFMGVGMETELDDEEFIVYTDEVPDQGAPWDPNGNGDNGDDWEARIIGIIQPLDGATVFGTCEIKGVSDLYEEDIQLVELQLDSASYDDWHSAKSNDDWETWSYQWDTEEFADGKYTINARGYDGDGYYYDSITVYVDRQAATAPQSTTGPKISVGDRYEYRLKANMDGTDIPEDAVVTGSMTHEVTGEETISVQGESFEVYTIRTSGTMEMSSSEYSMTNTMTGTIWMLKSDLTIVKEKMAYQSTETSGSPFGGGQYSSEEVITYSPPKNHYDFPLKVTESWEIFTTKTIESTETDNGETYSDTYTEDVTTRYECLRTDKVTVPAGTFDTFLVHYIEEEEYDDDSYGEEWDYEDSDDDGWSDDEEEYYGTDPTDPEDYPDFGEEGDGGEGKVEVEEEMEEEEEEGEGTKEEEESKEYEVYSEESGMEAYEYLYQEYTIEYYSPSIGYLAKIESYDHNRELMTTFELVSYSYKGEEDEPSSDTTDDFGIQIGDGYEISISVLLFIIVIVIIIILIAVVVIKQRRKKIDAIVVEELESESVSEAGDSNKPGQRR